MKLILHALRAASSRFGLSVFLFLTLFHVLLTHKRITGIEEQLEGFALKSSERIHTSLTQKDLGTLQDSLRLVLGKDATWLAFYAPELNQITYSPLLVGNVDINNRFQMTKTFELDFEGASVGRVEYHFNALLLTASLFRQNFILYVFVALFMISMIAYIHNGITRRLVQMETDLSRISELASKKNISVTDEFFRSEIVKLESHSYTNYSSGLVRVLKSLQLLITTEQKLKSLEATSVLAKQVAHDIRSPLSALDIVLATSQDMPEDKRNLARSAIARIKDIANDLLSQGPQQIIEPDPSHKNSVHLISTLLESIVSEKRVQYRSLLDVDIDFDLNSDSFGLFAEIDAIEFKRMISNLINNAVEALPEQKGRVIVTLGANADQIICEIQDNGKGIPLHLLTQLGRQGVSFGKEGTGSGSGLGLYHAKNTVTSWNGTLDIETLEGKGTRLIIQLNRATTPKWFQPSLIMSKGSRVVVIDDDASIHRIWENRLQQQLFLKEIEILHFSLPDAFAKWLARNASAQNIYLVDYEFLGSKQNGLDLISTLNIVNQSILVTSRHEEPQILSRAETMGVGIIPKTLAAIAPIQFARALDKPDAILIDDDSLVRQVWQTWAEDHGKRVCCYSTFEGLWSDLSRYSKDTLIYIDSNLGINSRGEHLSKTLYASGYKNLYLATGRSPGDFGPLPHLKGIVGKEPALALTGTDS